MSADRGNTDEIARASVRALLAGRADSVDAAIDLAMAESRAPHGGQRPSRAQLRAHAQAIEESEEGEISRALRIEATLQEALDVLSTLEETLISADPGRSDERTAPAPAVYGRAARGELDLDPSVHIRVVTALPPHVLAQALSDAGFGETEVRTIETRYGRLDEIVFDGRHAAYRIARIPPRARIDPRTDLVRGRPVESAGFEELVRRMPQFGNRGH